MYTKSYTDRKTFVKYDDNHYLLYLDEQEAQVEQPEGEAVPGYSYTGSNEDGGTMIEAKEATRAAFIAGLIRTRYSQNDVEAIVLNNLEPEQRESELAELQAFRTDCKSKVDEMLGR